MISESDRHIDDACDSLSKAIKSLSKIVVDECEGHDTYKRDYSLLMHETLGSLIAIKEKLKR